MSEPIVDFRGWREGYDRGYERGNVRGFILGFVAGGSVMGATIILVRAFVGPI